MTKTQKSPEQSMTRYYWWGFGGALAVLVIIGIIYFLVSNTGKLPSNFDESELPALPNEDGEPTFETFDESSAVSAPETGTATPSTLPESLTAFVGSWRLYSERLFYDEGGGGSTLSASSGSASTQKLMLKADGTYSFGDSGGSWSVEPPTADDWKMWGIESYGPTRKMTLEGWNKDTASGPIEEESGTVSFIWVLYRVEPPTVSKLGTVHMKFGKK